MHSNQATSKWLKDGCRNGVIIRGDLTISILRATHQSAGLI